MAETLSLALSLALPGVTEASSTPGRAAPWLAKLDGQHRKVLGRSCSVTVLVESESREGTKVILDGFKSSSIVHTLKDKMLDLYDTNSFKVNV